MRSRHPIKVVIRGKVLGPSSDELAGKVLWSARVYKDGKLHDGAGAINLFEIEDWAGKKYPSAHVTLTRPVLRRRHPHHSMSR
jgi:hypothetical protein